jgi:hypothetical protein
VQQRNEYLVEILSRQQHVPTLTQIKA